MTRYSDNIYSGYQGLSSALSSKSPVSLCKTYFVSAGAGVNITIAGTLAAGAQAINGSVYVVQQGAATTDDNIIMWLNGSAANGSKVLSWLAIGSAANQRYAPTYITSAAWAPQPPANNQTNGGEIPYKIIVSSVSTASYGIKIEYNRADSNTLGVTS